MVIILNKVIGNLIKWKIKGKLLKLQTEKQNSCAHYYQGMVTQIIMITSGTDSNIMPYKNSFRHSIDRIINTIKVPD